MNETYVDKLFTLGYETDDLKITCRECGRDSWIDITDNPAELDRCCEESV